MAKITSVRSFYVLMCSKGRMVCFTLLGMFWDRSPLHKYLLSHKIMDFVYKTAALL